MPIKILIADDHEVLREGLRTLLGRDPEFEVVAEASDGQTALEQALATMPDVAVIDLSMPILNGIDLIHRLNKDAPDTRVIVLSANLDQTSAAAALHAGALGLVPKASAFEEVALAIRTVITGKQYLSPTITADVMAWLLSPKTNGDSTVGAFAVLTPAERQVLQLIAEGHATKQIAAQLNRSVKTVETHRRNLMEKLQIDSVAGLTRYAVRQGLAAP